MKTFAAALLMALACTANAQDKKIKPAELPEDATAFIKTYFVNTKIKTVKKETDKNKLATFEVVLEDKTEIEFRENGTWKEVDGKGAVIPVSFVPKSFWKYIKENYPKEEITHIDKGEEEIEVDLTNGLELIFNQHGQFVRVDK